MSATEWLTWVFVGGVAVVLVVGLAVILQSGMAKLEEEKERLAREAKRQENERHAEMQTARAELEAEFEEKHKELDDEAQLALAETLQHVKDIATERYRPEFSATDLGELDKRLRESQLVASYQGRVLVVRVFAVPTGWVGIEWMVNADRPCPPKVVCSRNDKVLFTEFTYKGLFCDILPRGREHSYQMHAYDGKHDLEPDFRFVVKIPTEKQWLRRVPGPSAADDGNERETRIRQTIQAVAYEDELWEKARKEGYERIDASDDTDIEKRKRKARLDARISEARARHDKPDNGEQ